MRYFDEVEVEQPDSTYLTMPAHLSWTSTEAAKWNSPAPAYTQLRMVFPATWDIPPGQKIRWQGKRWIAVAGDELHTRRGKPYYKSATLSGDGL